MARLRNFQTNLTSGELDPKLRGRRTIKHWFNGASYLRNVILRPQGGVRRRDGSLFKSRIFNTVTRLQNDVVDGTLIDNDEATAGSSTFTTPATLTDKDNTTYTVDPSGTSANHIVDWGPSNAKSLSGITLREAGSVHALGSGSDRSVTVTVEGSATGAFGGEETTLGTGSITMKAGSANPFVAQSYDLSMDTISAFQFHRVLFSWTTAAAFFLSEIEFYRQGTPDPIVATAPNGGTADNAIDNDSSTEVLTTTNLSTTDPYVVIHYDLQATKRIAWVDVKGLKLSAAPPGADAMIDAFKVQYSTDDVAWNDYGRTFPRVDATDITRRVSNQDFVNARYWRLIKTGEQDGGTVKVHLDDFVLYEENSGVTSEVRQIPFIKDVVTRYMLVASDQNVRVFKDGVFQVDVAMPITSAQIEDMDFAQNLDTLLLFHNEHQPHKIFRESGDTDWSDTAQAFTSIPQHDFGSGNEDTWSDTRGWPRCGTFFQSRLWMAGSTQRPDAIWASKTDDLFNFNVGTGLDDEAIDKTILSDIAVAFHQLHSGRHLYAFGMLAEFYSEQSEDEILTPGNFDLRRTTKSGSKVGAEPHEVEGAVLFVQRGGSVIREFIFTDTEAAYQASNISLLSAHLIRNPVRTALRKAVTDDDADIYMCVNNDGTLATFTTLRTQDINAWTMQHTEGDFKSAGVDLDDIYTVTRRSVDFDGDLTAENNLYFEKWDPTVLVDAGVSGTVSVATTVISGLDHLEGLTVEAVLDSVNRGTFTVSSGSITVPSFSSTYQVGIPFADVTDDQDIVGDDMVELTDKQVLVRELPVEGELPDGSVAAKKKRVADIGLLFHETRHAELNGDDLAFRQLGAGILSTAVPLFTGMKRESGLLGWDLEGAVNVSQDRAAEFELLAIVKEVAA